MGQSLAFEKHQVVTFSLLQWVLRAIDKDGTGGMSHLHVETIQDVTTWVATDGRRMHIVYNQVSIPDGNYSVINTAKVISLSSAEDIIFPNWQRVIPTADSVSTLTDMGPFSSKGKTTQKNKHPAQSVWQLFQYSYPINLQYLVDTDYSGVFTVNIYKEKTAIVFDGENRKAIIASMEKPVSD